MRRSSTPEHRQRQHPKTQAAPAPQNTGNVSTPEQKIIDMIPEYSKNIAWIRVLHNDVIINSGTFFLLTERAGLTCHHVVGNAGYKIEVVFTNPEMGTCPHSLLARIEEYSEDDDWALLHVLDNIPGSPQGLLKYMATPPEDGRVAIIGCGWNSGFKKITIDYGSVVKFNFPKELGHAPFVHVLPTHASERLSSPNSGPNITYLCDSFSGAPMFNMEGRLVAMLSRGYTVTIPMVRNISIESGKSIVDIVTQISEENHPDTSGLNEESNTCSNTSATVGNALDMLVPRFSHLNLGHFPSWETETPQIPRKIKKESGGDRPSFKLTLACTVNDEEELRMLFPQSTSIWEDQGMRTQKPSPQTTQSYKRPLTLKFTTKKKNDLNANIFSQKTSTLRSLLRCETPIASENSGCFICDQDDCQVCRFMTAGENIEYCKDIPPEMCRITERITCKSTYVVYVITCKMCEQQYVGHTTKELKVRIQEHLSETKLTSVTKHFPKGDLKFSFQGIQMIDTTLHTKEEQRVSLLKAAEATWIWRLQTVEQGLNVKSESVNFTLYDSG